MNLQVIPLFYLLQTGVTIQLVLVRTAASVLINMIGYKFRDNVADNDDDDDHNNNVAETGDERSCRPATKC